MRERGSNPAYFWTFTLLANRCVKWTCLSDCVFGKFQKSLDAAPSIACHQELTSKGPCFRMSGCKMFLSEETLSAVDRLKTLSRETSWRADTVQLTGRVVFPESSSMEEEVSYYPVVKKRSVCCASRRKCVSVLSVVSVQSPRYWREKAEIAPQHPQARKPSSTLIQFSD